jgi:integrase
LRCVCSGLHKFAYINYYCDDWRGTLYIPQGHKRGQREILQPADIARLFEPSDLWYANAFRVMLLCGLRPGECLGLQESDVRGGLLFIRRAINDRGEITPGKNKNAQRVIPLPPIAAQIINETIERNRCCNFGTPWIFCNAIGGPAAQYMVRKDWAKLKTERDLPGTPYCLRHTFVSIVSSQTHLAEGTIRELVGHSESMDTFGTYKHAVSGELERAADIINLTFERLRDAK